MYMFVGDIKSIKEQQWIIVVNRADIIFSDFSVDVEILL